MPQFLLELFSEEIPARFQKQAATDLQRLFTEHLTAQGLAFSGMEAHVTPRRLALVVDGLPLEQPARTEEKKGPKVDAPAAAIAGFLKSAGLESVDQCEQRETPKGKVFFATTQIPGQKTADILPGLIDLVLRAMPWKKSMNWGEGTFRWVRPLHAILAILDGTRLDGSFDLGPEQPRLVFTDHTQGHRFLSSGSFAVTNFADYVAKLRDAGVILDREERKRIIVTEAETLLAAQGLTLKPDDALLEEVCGLVEWPVPLLGRIDDQFMDIPPEVLVTTMRNNQKYFASRDAQGRMSPVFVVVANITTEDGGAAIVAGNQRVLRARFADAKFFWDLDRATKLADFASRLDTITFHARLGSVAEKVARMARLAASFAPCLPVGVNVEEIRTAAHLCKADLVTGMVGEFPELQGVMGGYYARHEGQTAAVATAITEHYSPLGPTDTCPTAPVSVALALADKLDTLVGFFGIGEKPTGSKDPYALRRAALGVLRLSRTNGLKMGLRSALETAYAGYPTGTLAAREQVIADVAAFLTERLTVLLRDEGFRVDHLRAVFGPEPVDHVTQQLRRLAALREALGTETGTALLALYKRAVNILRIEEKRDGVVYAGPAESSRLEKPEEKTLCDALARVDGQVAAAVQVGQYAEAMTHLLTLRAAVDAFFVGITVNADDPALRMNRLRLLADVRAVTARVADFAAIEGDDAGRENNRAVS